MSKTALLVIDEQLGAFDGKVLPAIFGGDALLNKSAKLIESFRSNGLPIIYIQHCAAEGALLRGADGWAIHPAITPEPGERVVQKTESSAFQGTDLVNQLVDQNVGTIVVCGLQSELCVANTTFDALELGYAVYVISDAHSTWSNSNEPATEIIQRCNRAMASQGAQLAETRTLISGIKEL